MIDREHDLSVTRQAEILKVSRGMCIICRALFLHPIPRSCGSLIGCTRTILRGPQLLKDVLKFFVVHVALGISPVVKG
jgi:hypothetical protein